VRKFFLRSALKIPYILLNNYNIETRHRFKTDNPVLHALYVNLLKIIGSRLRLPVKVCECCGIKYLPDYRTWRHQKYCGYGCTAYNRRRNRKKAKRRYMSNMQGKLLASKYNHQYRHRKQSGHECILQPEGKQLEETARKLSAQIKYIYRHLNPESDTKKLAQLDRILSDISRKTSNA
jgi:hypothetical protein